MVEILIIFLYVVFLKGKKMRSSFEAWALSKGHIVRRRENKPEEYLFADTERCWMIWQAASTYGKTGTPQSLKVTGQQHAPTASQRLAHLTSDEASVRNDVLNELLTAFTVLPNELGIADIVKVIKNLGRKSFFNGDTDVAQKSQRSARQ